MPYRGVKRVLWRAYTAFEECNVQWMADHVADVRQRRGAGARSTRAPDAPVIETTTTTISRARHRDARRTPAPGRRIRLLTVSRIDPRKGLRVLPEVVAPLRRARLRRRRSTSSARRSARPARTSARRSRRGAARWGVGDRVRLLGAVPLDQLLPLYRDYDLFVLPTLPGEGIPRVLLEAMTAGVPIVTTRVAGIPSLIDARA